MADRRQALVLIDLQVDYFTDDELARCREDLVATCNRLVAAARWADVSVIEARTVHALDTPDATATSSPPSCSTSSGRSRSGTW
jgi:nicotinamidase-related amidase